MSILEVGSGLVRLHPSRTLKQHAGNNLQAVGYPMLDFAKQDGLVMDQIVLQLLASPKLRDIGAPQQKSYPGFIVIVELVRIDDQMPNPSPWALKVHLVGLNISSTGGRGRQQRGQFGAAPLAFAKFSQMEAGSPSWVDPESQAERYACRNHRQVFGKQEQRRADEAERALLLFSGITAVITDIRMPGSMDGLELATKARRLWPALSLLIVSGEVTPVEVELPARARFLPKPYSPEEISEALAELRAQPSQ